jgi:signal transduction histidine kinase
MTDYDLFPKQMADIYRANDLTVLAAKAALEWEEVFPQDDGVHTYLSIKFPLYDAAGVAYAVCGISTDITKRKRAEEDIRKALDKEKELGELKSRFITMASHEFRTPLATILSSTDLLKNYSHKLTEEKKLNYLQQTQVAVKHMTDLLNDVLLIGKAEAGKLQFQPTAIDLGQFCRDLVDEIQLTTNNYIITFCTQEQSINAYLDEKLLRQILNNLLSNAIKYSPSGSTVHFDLVCQQGEAILRIQDQGIGIPIADQAQLFNSFHRASNVGTISGTGLGLAIVKKSVDLHGGRIFVESEVSVGTTFTVTLPLNY